MSVTEPFEDLDGKLKRIDFLILEITYNTPTKGSTERQMALFLHEETDKPSFEGIQGIRG